MKRATTVLVALATMVAIGRAADPIVLTHTGADDIFLRESAPDANQGDDRNLFGGQKTTAQFVTLMKFTLTPLEPGATITSVQLDLGAAMTAGAGTADYFEGNLYQYTDFDAATATWNDPDGTAGSDATAGGTFGTALATETFDARDWPNDVAQAFSSTSALVGYLQTAYDAGDAEVFFRLGNDGTDVGVNAFMKTDSGTVTGTGQAFLTLGFDEVVNTPPEWQQDPITDGAVVDRLYGRDLSGEAIDADGDPITYSMVGPAWLSVTTNGVLSGTPLVANEGSNTFTVAATDGISGTNTTSLEIWVELPTLPEWQEDPIAGASGYANEDYSDTLAGKATDANGDPIIYSLVGTPTWLTVGGDGVLGGTPGVGDVGPNTFTVRATDIDGSVDATLNIYVSATLPMEIMFDGFDAANDFAGNGWDTSLNVNWTMSTGGYGNPSNYVFAAGDTGADDPSHEVGIISKDTGYAIASADQVTLSFEYADTAATPTNGAILAKLYYKDGGSDVELGQVEVADPQAGGWFVGELILDVPSESVGHNLFVSFEGSGGDGLSAQRLGLENVRITAVNIAGEAVTISISGSGSAGTEMELSWTNQVGKTYAVETNSNLIIESGWNSWTSGVGGAEAMITITAPITEDQTFYRVITE